MSLSHFHPPGSPRNGLSPCGKRLNLCNWTTGASLVTCRECVSLIEWRPVPGFSNYEVSNFGEVRNASTGLMMRPCVLKRGGYLAVNLWASNKGHTRTVHQLVALAFHGPRPSLRHHAAHRDGRKSNNAATNIRWATKEENEADKRMHGTANIGERNGSAKFSADTVRAMRAAHADGLKPAEISRSFGIEQSHLSRILNGHLWSHV